MWCPWRDRGRKLYLLVTVWVFVSAALDEIHQLFVPGRYGSIADVLLDTCGGIFGILLCVLIEHYLNHKKLNMIERKTSRPDLDNVN
jgi:VanZ family protein